MITQQLPSCFLLFLDLHTPQPWDAMSSLFMCAALPFNTSPLAHLSRVPLCLGCPIAWVPWACMKQQGEAGCTWWQFGIRAASMGYMQPPWGLGSQSDAFWPPLMLAFLDRAHPLQRKPQELITLCQGYHECKVVIIHRELCLGRPLHNMTPLSSMLEAAQHWGKSWAQLKQTNEPWRQELPATKDFSYKLSLSKHLKNVTRLHRHCCSVSTSRAFLIFRVMLLEVL